ncbi:MAG: type IV pilus secretin PilQ [Gammaproteobacteria bacterium]|nr:type IV pilus secretin PilQ [Gammaproteobacteria bacterium]
MTPTLAIETWTSSHKTNRQKRILGSILFLFSALLLVLTSINSTHAASSNTLQKISYSTLTGNRLQIALQMTHPPSTPQGFTIDNPARITLDLADTKNGLKKRLIPIGVGVVRSINTVEASGRSRVVINLNKLTPYKTHIDGNTLYLTLDTGTRGANQRQNNNKTITTSRQIDKTAPTSMAPPAILRSIHNINFRRGADGEGRIIIKLSEAGIPMDVNEENGRIVIDFLGTGVPQKLVRRLNVLDFATPVKHIDVMNRGNNARLIISPINQEYEQLAYQSDDLFTLELRPISKRALEKKNKEKFGYTGKRLSLNFQDIEVRAVLQLLADFTELNIVVSDTVTGRLTLRLKNVPWDQALDIILKSKGLGVRKNGNVLLVAPNEEIATREKLELEALQQVEELAPLKTEFIQINYAKAAEIAAMLKSKESSLLSTRGNVSVDPRTNTLLVHDTAEKLNEIRGLVVKLDIPVRQVLIESRIVIASNDFGKELGVRFGVHQNDLFSTGSTGGTLITSSSNTVTEFSKNEALTSPDRFNVNLPVANAAGSIALALAKLPFGTLLELELSAMQAEGRGEVVSSPRVITANQKEALIEQGVEIPYLESSSSGAATITFRKAVLSLKVTPQITPDDHVIMDLQVNKDSVGEIFEGVPSIDTREVKTQVLVNNGETVVLGGIYEQSNTHQVNRIPFFSELPLIGGLFKKTLVQDQKNELLVFVTPKIVKNSVGLNY